MGYFAFIEERRVYVHDDGRVFSDAVPGAVELDPKTLQPKKQQEEKPQPPKGK